MRKENSLFEMPGKAPLNPVEKNEAHSSGAGFSEVEPAIEEKLADIPDVIELPQSAAQQRQTEEKEAEENALIARATNVINVDAVDRTIRAMFLMLDRHFGTEHWTLSDLEGQMLSGPLTEMLRYTWSKIAAWLPSILVRNCENVPGLAMFALACGVVLVPRGREQMRMNVERGKKPLSFAAYKKAEVQPEPEFAKAA